MPRDGEIVNEELAVLARQTQPRYVHYADYKPKEDFTTWLSGYITRIKTTLGFKNNEMNKVKEVILSVSEQVGSFDKVAKRLGMEKIGTNYRRVF